LAACREDPRLRIAARCSSADEVLAAIQERSADVVLVDEDLHLLDDEHLEYLAAADTPTIVLSREANSERWRTTPSLVVLSTEAEAVEVLTALAEMGQNRRQRNARAKTEFVEPRPTAVPDLTRPGYLQVLAIWSGPGSPGRTTIAINWAALLGSVARTVIVDLNLTGAAITAQLDQTQPDIARLGFVGSSILQLASANPDSPESWLHEVFGVARPMGPLSPHTDVLAGVLQPWLRTGISAEFVARLIAELRRHYQYVLLDLGDEPLGEATREAAVSAAALAAADQILVVCPPDTPGLHQTYMALAQAGLVVDRERTGLVVNRYESRYHQANTAAIEEALKCHSSVCCRSTTMRCSARWALVGPWYAIASRSYAARSRLSPSRSTAGVSSTNTPGISGSAGEAGPVADGSGRLARISGCRAIGICSRGREIAVQRFNVAQILELEDDDRPITRLLRRQLRERLAQMDADGGPTIEIENEARVRLVAREIVEDYQRRALSTTDTPRLADAEAAEKELVSDQLGAGPLQVFMDDPSIEEIGVDDYQRVWLWRVDGTKELVQDQLFENDDEVVELVRRLIRRLHRQFNIASSIVDAALPGGARLNAVLSGISRLGTTVTIRKFPRRYRHVAEIVRTGELDWSSARFLLGAVAARCNILISGGMGTGKSTLMDVLLCDGITSPFERIVLIAETHDLSAEQVLPDCIVLELDRPTPTDTARSSNAICSAPHCACVRRGSVSKRSAAQKRGKCSEHSQADTLAACARSTLRRLVRRWPHSVCTRRKQKTI
jgi:MinD-like ATPase involved in chromosome partitioning or flagellar assembly